MGKDLIRHFSKKDMQISNRHMERCSMLLIIREMQNHKTSLHTCQNDYQKRSQITHVGVYVKKREPLYTVGGGVN